MRQAGSGAGHIYEFRRDILPQIFEYRRMVSPATPASPNLFGRRMREARDRVGLAQDKLGVRIGLDESTSSARISRYETGTHEPTVPTARLIAKALNVPLAYLYCEDDTTAAILLQLHLRTRAEREHILAALRTPAA